MRDTLRCEHGFTKPCTVCDPFVCAKLDPSLVSTPGQWEMPSQPDAIVFVIAPNHRWFELWCQVDNTPSLNPRDRRWRVLCSIEDLQRLARGRRWREGDKVLWLNGPPHKYPFTDMLRSILIPAGFVECEGQDGRTFRL